MFLRVGEYPTVDKKLFVKKPVRRPMQASVALRRLPIIFIISFDTHSGSDGVAIYSVGVLHSVEDAPIPFQ